MTNFNVSAMRALQGEFDAARMGVEHLIAAVLACGTWPEPLGLGDPASMYAIWVKAWREELMAANETLTAVSTGLGNVAQILEEVDRQAADAFTLP